MDLVLDLYVKLVFEYVVFILLVCVIHPWFSLAHPCCDIEETWTFESVYVKFGIGVFMLKCKFVLRTSMELYMNNETGFSY